METRQLEYFLLLAKEEHVSTAASILNISQPALSKSLAKLEEEVGTKLFDRHGNSIRLNDHGRNFAKYAQECIDTLNMGLTTTRQGRFDILGEVTIVFHAFANVLTDCIMSYKDLNPYIKFTLIADENSHNDYYNELFGNYDFIFGGTQEPVLLAEQNRVWFADPLAEESLGILFSPSVKSYPPGTTSVSLADFRDVPFISAPKFSTFFSDLTTNLCLTAGFAPKIYCCTFNFNVYTKFVRAGKAVYILHSKCAEAALKLAPELCFCQIKEKPITRTLFLIHKDRALMSEAALDFLDFAIDYFHPACQSRTQEI